MADYHRSRRVQNRRRPWEFKKKLAAWAVVIATAAAAASYVLAAAGRETAGDVSVTRFPWLAKSVSFEVFSLLVDDALEDMRKMLENNMAVRAIVNGEDTQND